jgi:uncharacterized protein (DUF4415 family)
MSKRKLNIPPITDEEEERIQAGIALDPDNPEITAEEFKLARPFAEVLPELSASIKRARGRPVMERPRKLVSIRMDQDVLDKFRATGKGWQSRVNEALRKASGL